MDPVVEYHESPNWSYRTRPVLGIVDHVMAGTFLGTREWFVKGSAEAGRPVSAHYGVSKEGRIDKYVYTTRVAWHCGIVNNPTAQIYFEQGEVNPNAYMLGIEHEGFPEDGLTEEQYQATLWLHKRLVITYGIRVGRDRIIGHRELDAVNRANCPGLKFPWDRLMGDLTEHVLREGF